MLQGDSGVRRDFQRREEIGGDDLKTAVTIAGEHAGQSAFVVWRGFQESMRKAAEYGYDGVELALKGAGDIEVKDLRCWLKRYGLEVSCITTGQVFSELGLYFTHPDAGMRKKTIEVYDGLIDLAGEFGGIVNVGRARGFRGQGQTGEETEKLFADTMQELCTRAEKKQVQIIVEPVNRYEINFINSLDEGAAVLEKVQRSNCGLHADVFHMNIEDDRIGESLVRNGKWVRYVHLADSNRLAPGCGHLDFDEVFSALKEIGYDGWVSVEILPGDHPDEMAKKAIQYIKPKVLAYNSGFINASEWGGRV